MPNRTTTTLAVWLANSRKLNINTEDDLYQALQDAWAQGRFMLKDPEEIQWGELLRLVRKGKMK